MNATTVSPIESSTEQISTKQVMLDVVDTLNSVIEYMGRWSYQVRGMSYLANSEANDVDYPIFPHTIRMLVI